MTPQITTDAPYVVAPTDRTGSWKITKGEPSRSKTIEKYDTKSRTVSRAERLAINNQNIGVVVLDRDGNFLNFRETRRWFKKFESDRFR